MPTSDWEAIFVDDGSSDDTYARLTLLASTHPHFQIAQIENSGWPSRPRNVGIEMARGEYIAFMDHDDELFPDALDRGYAYASAHNADVLNGKEARTTDAGWAIDYFARDIPQALEANLDHSALAPTNPHKMYRRALLMDHHIRFREGGRVLWEDIFFNVDVLRHARTVSTMSSTPYYHWRTTAGSGSTTFQRNHLEWWFWLDEVVRAIDETLTAPHLASERSLLRTHQYRNRLIDSFYDRYARRAPERRKLIFDQAHRLQANHFPQGDDAHLSTSGRLRASLLRRKHPHALQELVRADPTLKPVVSALSTDWRNGSAHITVEVVWRDALGARMKLRERGGHLFKDLSAPFERLFSEDQLDVTDEISAARATIGIRSGKKRIAWLVPSSSTVQTTTGSTPRFNIGASGVLDPSTAAMGSSIDHGRWDVTAQCMLGDGLYQPRVDSNLPPAIRVTAEGAMTLHSDTVGCLVLDPASADPLSLMRRTGRTRLAGDELWIELQTDEIAPDAAGFTAELEFADHPHRRGLPSRLGSIILPRRMSQRAWQRRQAELIVAQAAVWLRIDVSRPNLIRLGARRPEGASVILVSSKGVSESRHR